MIHALINGFLFGFSLILAIGAQNVMVLRQGLLMQHVFIVCLLCALSDALLIQVGVFGMATIAKYAPAVASVMTWLGAAFLFAYGVLRWKAAFSGSSALNLDVNQQPSRKRVILTALALTWLNPHVYLDTVLLLGTVANDFAPYRAQFAIGATTASFVFFFTLGYGARLLRPALSKPRTWQVLEFAIGLFMFYLAAQLLLSQPHTPSG
ncbi:LysE/ArgO family amino acid transporter [Cardiobacteriaceae bacterium TAE3-ERU3]|nr:LysE/ArgO family amino acid transporter [Cardiobacteriaceae bacterium TAE3-ERU3]